ncbi:DUF2155 domain-containing protein [Geoalkalibacter sp.]|uniref:DUF2155 domain-containing protein n=1 Tax=Geoalkalibacter sp. TaxID=3041440 RepID=UPI00272E18C8|nr:DUF2155 domain-containing protein [Geoalkalibacter sp.]
MLALILAPLLLFACTETRDEPSAAAPRVMEAVSIPAAQRAHVVIPPEVKGQWQAVRILVVDRETDQKTLHTVDIGEEFCPEGTSLGVRVLAFLPDFIMHGLTMTSSSNQLNNPGVQIRIRDADEELFVGWLFSLYPEAHAYYHPRYGFALVDFIPAAADEHPEK